MNMLERMNEVVGYIEQELAGEISYERLAQLACCSQYQLQRMFGFIADMPLSEYIRRRRLTCAAFDLQNSDQRIIDIAVKYGYGSADAFARAFHNLHGIKPSKARDKGARLKAYPRITFTLSIKGVVEMNYRIEERPDFNIIGIKKFVTMENGENFKIIPKMWCDLTEGECQQILSLNDMEPTGVLGVCAEPCKDKNGFDYWIAAASTKACPREYQTLVVPASTWAVFEVVGAMPDAIQTVTKRIYSEWLPSSGYEHADAPEFEWYSDGDTDADDYLSEVWIPVVKK